MEFHVEITKTESCFCGMRNWWKMKTTSRFLRPLAPDTPTKDLHFKMCIHTHTRRESPGRKPHQVKHSHLLLLLPSSSAERGGGLTFFCASFLFLFSVVLYNNHHHQESCVPVLWRCKWQVGPHSATVHPIVRTRRPSFPSGSRFLSSFHPTTPEETTTTVSLPLVCECAVSSHGV